MKLGAQCAQFVRTQHRTSIIAFFNIFFSFDVFDLTFHNHVFYINSAWQLTEYFNLLFKVTLSQAKTCWMRQLLLCSVSHQVLAHSSYSSSHNMVKLKSMKSTTMAIGCTSSIRRSCKPRKHSVKTGKSLLEP